MTIWFDMDGTIADLYGVDGWLEYLLRSDVKPYAEAKALINLSRLARRLNILKEQGYKIGVISWGCKNASAEYDRAVEDVKRAWLARHLKSVEFDAIKVLPYGTPKHIFKRGNDILFDVEAPNRQAWGSGAYDMTEIFEVLGAIA